MTAQQNAKELVKQFEALAPKDCAIVYCDVITALMEIQLSLAPDEDNGYAGVMREGIKYFNLVKTEITAL